MKFLINTFFVVLTVTYSLFGFCGELRFFIDDQQSSDYKIIATRISLDDPLFGDDFTMIDPSIIIYNNVVSEIKIPVSPPWDFYIGFDYVRDGGSICWPLIGEGKYEIKIQRGTQTVIKFSIDLISYSGSPDIDFYYQYAINHLVAIHSSSGTQTEINDDDWVNCWDLRGETRNITNFQKEVEITNTVNGLVNNNLSTTLEGAQYGFPYDVYPVGYEFTPGEVVHFWRGGLYGLSVEPELSIGGTEYLFRNWKNYNDYSPSTVLKILSETDEIQSLFYPFQSVPVINYLEGGTSIADNYSITWQNVEDTIILNFGTAYNSFVYQSPTNDLYSFEALPINIQRYSTTWSFLKWNNDSYNSTISNKKIPDDIPTEGSFIAKYKGHLRSDNNYSFSNNGQRHLVRDENGIYHLYYISLDDNLWYTKSLTTDFNGAWSAEDLVYPGANVKSLSVDIYNNTIYTVLELFTGVKYAIQCLVTDTATGTVTGLFDVTVIDQSYFGSAHPVVAVSENEKFFLYRRTSQGGLYYSRYCTYNGVNYDEFDVLIPNTSSGSLNPAIAVNKTGIPDLHLTYQEGNINGKSIRYRWANGSFYNQRTFTSPLSISEASAYYINTDPSLSLFKKNSSDYEPIVSWLGGDGGAPYKSNGFSIPTPRLIVRACDDYSSGRWGLQIYTGKKLVQLKTILLRVF